MRDAIGIMGASSQFFKFDEIMMMKGLRSQTYRLNNIDNANFDKSIKAAEKQILSIRRIIEERGLDFLSAKLREAAELRLENPEFSLRELGESLTPPITRSGVNHRMKRLLQIADEIFP